jgi:glutamate transport system permease protein
MFTRGLPFPRPEVAMSVSYLFETYGSAYLQALLNTWEMTIISFIGCMALALVITVMRVCPIAPLRKVGDLYVQIFRNIAGISLLVFFYYAFPYLGILWGERTCVILVVVLVASAFGSENFMSGINTIGVGQIEAARSLGLSFTQIIKDVVIPQALRSAILPMTNLLIAVLLTTALGSQVPLNPKELTGMVSYINTRDVGGILPFTVSALCYAGTSFVIGVVGNRIDRKVRILR